MLKGKHILLGITGSIAAYKAAVLARYLVKEGAEVKVIMTDMAKQFITPLTMATVTKNPILVDFYNPENGDWNSHISLGMWADLYLIAPASANTIAKMSAGIADNLLLTTYLSARCPVAVAPAMDMDMFLHDVTQNNILTLEKRGVKIIEPGSGELASGLEGKGRMEEPEVILQYVKGLISSKEKVSNFSGNKIVITAGPTVEKIDPVRFLSNFSTGKMGYAIAEEFATRGASVTLISGPVNIKTVNPSVKVIKVTTAEEMYRKTTEEYNKGCNIVVLAAAVADFTPQSKSESKIKSQKDNLTLNLAPTKDIAASLGEIKRKNTIHIGFALETDDELINAGKKLKSKNFDAIVLNSLRDEGAGFATDTNKITIIGSDGTSLAFPLKSKSEAATDIVDYVEKLFLC